MIVSAWSQALNHAATELSLAPGRIRLEVASGKPMNYMRKRVIATSGIIAVPPAIWILIASFFIAQSAHASPCAGQHLNRLVEAIHEQAPNIGTKAILTAIGAYSRLKLQHLTDKPLVTIVDYSLPSAKRRLAVADVQTGKVLFYTYVAHGRGSGLNYATLFSNEPGTDASSLGVYLTGRTYYGQHGFSLRLHGLDPGFNSAAYRRDIVIHSAWYVSKTFAQEHGRVGRSWGCFALNPKVEGAVVTLIRAHTVLVVYYPDPKWLNSSPFLNGPADSARNSLRTSRMRLPAMTFTDSSKASRASGLAAGAGFAENVGSD
jgi:hypothetical protein